ncbi:MAG TPA: NAD-dependent epimerase/dehydratase family protein [Bacteroidetes bacterium]|nr:NAD-dependent epimerase/dehydratase family protein [Bacteroidota bacterium]
MEEKKILVTGATGFVGAYLLHYLVRRGGAPIVALKRKNSPMSLVEEIRDKVEWVDGDIMDTTCLEEIFEGIGQIYHCAAVVSFHGKDESRMLRTNREGTANVVNVALAKGVGRLLHVSSIAALGRRKNQSIVDENTPWEYDNWNSPYAVSKHLAEMEVWRGIAEGLDAVIVNPSNILGSGFWKGRTSTGQLFYKIWKGMPFYPLGSSGFVDVRDVVRFMVGLMESGISGERFIVSAENLPFQTVLFEIADALGVKRPGVKVGPLLREVAWRVAWLASKASGERPFITKQTARSSARVFYYQNKKSLEVFPFSYTPVKTTIADTARQFREAVREGFSPKVLPF